jgi:hypothetical protein
LSFHVPSRLGGPAGTGADGAQTGPGEQPCAMVACEAAAVACAIAFRAALR